MIYPRGFRRLIRLQLKQALHNLRKTYEQELLVENKSAIGGWLCDNFYLLEREGRQTARGVAMAPSLPHPDSGGLPRMFVLCRRLCKERAIGTREDLVSRLLEEGSGKPFQNVELEMFPILLRAALILSAAESCGHRDLDGKKELSYAVERLRNMPDIDFDALLEQVSPVERILMTDPSGVYPKMDDASRTLYRSRVVAISHKEHMEESEIARRAVSLAAQGKNERERHVGAYLFPPKNTRRGTAFLWLEGLVPLLLCSAVSVFTPWWWLGILLYLPMWEITRPVLSHFSLLGVRPERLVRLDLEQGVPPEGQTLVTVSTLLPTAERCDELRERLLTLYESNGGENIYFCILADLKASDAPVRPEDRADIAAAKRVVAECNKSHNNAFYLMIRPRTYSETQNAYTGAERKRGAIAGLCAQIQGEEQGYLCLIGDKSKLRQTRYLMALDADTEMPLDSLSPLIGAALHPLNQPMIDSELGRVTLGYGIFCPNVAVSLDSAAATPFSRCMAGNGGVTAYDTPGNERYQDLFCQGIFAGKGLINVAVFHEMMKNALPKEQVLSHDILEGGYLRAAYLSDVAMTDGFPTREVGYLSRMHRWVRGDWQNLPFLLQKNIKTPSGVRKNPLSALSKYKLLDNLRRSLTPAVSFLLLLSALFMPGLPAVITVAAAALSACAGNLYSGVRSLFSGGIAMFSRRFYAGAKPSALVDFTMAACNVMMLAQTGAVCGDAILRALFRRYVTHKQLLQWVTAANSDRAMTPGVAVTYYLPSLLTGALLLLFGGAVLRLMGLLTLGNFFFGTLSGKPSQKRDAAYTPQEKEFLLSGAAAMWRFYEEFATAAEHYLPPDNVQETPVHRVAHRTSPTNIGMMMLCTLAARDFHFIDSTELCRRLGLTLTSVEQLETWNGNLLNWYDTRTLKPLLPSFVSAVDSGNFLCCLVALSQGIREYAGECPALLDLVRRIDALVNQADVSVMYNEKRKLFTIGYDLQEQKPSASYYDLLMSEARMLSYFAIATGQAPKKHWGALGRTMARDGGYTGPVSWTGTMFEYFMPHLLLPVYDNSLLWEALRFALRCQKKRGRDQNLPWGISESGFYAFDQQFNYQYKAHGVQKLGLKRGLDFDYVAAPYASFLALPFVPRQAIRNLMRLKSLGMTGRCGFYEAVDFTRERLEDIPYGIVRSYMAHHVGMSMLSVSNALFHNKMQRRFIRDEQMKGAASLLQEQIPVGAVVFRDVELREVPRHNPRSLPKVKTHETPNPAAPEVTVLSNGEYTLVLSDCGASFSSYRGADLTRRDSDLLRRPLGLFAVLCGEGASLPFSRGPDYNAHARFTVDFSRNCVKYHARRGMLEGSMAARVHQNTPCEERHLVVKNHAGHSWEGGLLLYLEPSLTEAKEEASHPAFSKLFIEPSYDKDNSLLLFSRRSRSGGQPLFLAVGLLEAIPFTFETERTRVLERPFGTRSLAQNGASPFQNHLGVTDVCCALHIPLSLPARGQKSLHLLLAAASSADEAREHLLGVRRQGALKAQNSGGSPFQPDGLDGVLADHVLPHLFFTGDASRAQLRARSKNHGGQPNLWPLGISGDLPIIAVKVGAQGDSSVAPYFRLHQKLRWCGILTDLAVLFEETTGYQQPMLDSLRLLAEQSHVEKSLHAVNGGIFLLNQSTVEPAALETLEAAAVYLDTGEQRMGKVVPLYEPLPIQAGSPAPVGGSPLWKVWGGCFYENKFTITKKPPMPWCTVLSNERFGTLVSANALGYTWAVNARENKLTPWFNDPATDNNGELLLIRQGEKLYNVLRNARPTFSPEEACWQGKIQSVSITVTVRVPKHGTFKACDIILENEGEEACTLELAYYLEPILGVGVGNRPQMKSEWLGQSMAVHSPWSSVPGYLLLHCSEKNCAYCCSRPDFFMGKWAEKKLLPQGDGCVSISTKIELPGKARHTLRYVLGWAEEKSQLEALPSSPVTPNLSMERTLRVHTPEEALNVMINTWLPAQTMESRITGRTGFYQCGGATGFRDQLQDVLSLLLPNPSMVREQLLRCAAHQFKEGDVLHWWHTLPNGIHGVRTRYSDDLLWMPYGAALYCRATGDFDVLKEEIPYLQGEPLQEGEMERYFTPTHGEESGTLYEHCISAIEHSMRRGAHGLPLMGGGDWNDGYNRVGAKGRGESVWLAEFLALVLELFAPACAIMEDEGRQTRYEEEAVTLKKTIEAQAWDGQWYLRAFYDDGTPMGSAESEECKIDSLPQSFATLCGLPNEERNRQALTMAAQYLVDEEHRLIQLFTPGFSGQNRAAGYVTAYPPGIRENGGQYTHAAVWLCLAFLRQNRVEEGWALLNLLNPALLCHKEEWAKRYAKEPYALCGDVSSHPGIEGRGGWSLYTGAAGWYYKTVTEELLGFHVENNRLFLRPKLPAAWPGFEATLTAKGGRVHMVVTKGQEQKMTVNGTPQNDVPLDGGVYEVKLTVNAEEQRLV